MSVFPVVFLLGLMCFAPVMLAVAIGLAYWAWQNRAHWPDPKVFLIVGGVALLLFLMLGVTSISSIDAEIVHAPIQVAMPHGDAFDSTVPHVLPHHVTVPAPVIVRHDPMSWGLMLIIGLNLLFGFGVVLFWRMSRASSAATSATESTSNVGRDQTRWIAPVVVATLTAVLLAGLALPALQHSRETARREALRAQLHDIGKALHGDIPRVEVFPAPMEYKADLALWSVGTFLSVVLVMGLVAFGIRRALQPATPALSESYSDSRQLVRGRFIPVVVGLTSAMLLLGLIGIYRFRAVNAQHAALQAQRVVRLEQEMTHDAALKSLTRAEADALQRLENSRNIDTGLTRISETDAASALTPLNNDLLPQADRTRTTENAAALEPAWIHGTLPPSVDGKLQVISSGQFASEDEARADANRQCVQLLATDLEPYISGVPFRWRRSALMTGPVSTAIQQQYVQQFERDFGSFFAPMYRVWYLVELSPRVREPAITMVKAESQEGRVIVAGVAFAALWLAPLGMVLAGRTVRALGVQSRGLVLAGMTFAVLSAWAATGLVLNEYLVIING